MSSRSLRASVTGRATATGASGQTDQPLKNRAHRNSTMGIFSLFSTKNSISETSSQSSFYGNRNSLISTDEETDSGTTDRKNRGSLSRSPATSTAFLNPLASINAIVQQPLIPVQINKPPQFVLSNGIQLLLAGQVHRTGQLENEYYRPFYDDDEEMMNCWESASDSDEEDEDHRPSSSILIRQYCIRRKGPVSIRRRMGPVCFRTQSCHSFGDEYKIKNLLDKKEVIRRNLSTPTPEFDRETDAEFTHQTDADPLGSSDLLRLLFDDEDDDSIVFERQIPAEPCHIHPHLSQ